MRYTFPILSRREPMAILPGKRLGPYEILSAIGAGGMGEVYKARDTRLDRIVAIKVLPTHLADQSELRERFDREARTIASLNHPHICTLHDIGHQDGIDYLVMEYLEGQTLAQRLQKGALPPEQVLEYAIEISDALDKAHRKGVTHRDLKPGNIMLTKSGTKLLDFGLAKLKQEAAPENVPLSDLPTAKDPLTAQGTILGTLQYMAPEQLEGKDVDVRTDIFAFGAVVYEMATGKRAFDGKTQASVIGAIMSSEPPPMSTLQPMTPPALDRVVKKCLAKEPDDRWHAAKDLCDELRWIAGGSSQAIVAPLSAAKGIRGVWRQRLILGLCGLSIGAAIASFVAWSLEPSLLRPVSRLTIALPPGQQLAGMERSPSVAISSDGTNLAYVATQGGSERLYLRAMDSLESKPVPGSEGAFNPFFSPDGQWLGFFADAKLKKVSVSGGAAVTLSEATVPFGASWGSHGTIIFSPTTFAVLQQMQDGGGPSQPLTHFENREISHRWPEILPDGKAVLFAASMATANWANAQVAVQSLVTGERRNLIQGATQPRYASSGHLIYAQGGALIAAPFDPRRNAVLGAAVPVVDGIQQSIPIGDAQYSISSTGTLVYVSGGLQSFQSRLVWVNRNGTEQILAAPPHTYRAIRLSPDGQRIAVGIEERETQVWLYDSARETLSRLTFEGTNLNPTWSPDGKRIAFIGESNIFWQPSDGSGVMERLTTNEYFQSPFSWSPDGQLLAFSQTDPITGYDIWILKLGNRKAQPFLRTPFNEAAPEFSPDGKWLAYISNESGRYEVYVQPYPGPGGKWQISTDGGTEPMWNRNGRELFYRSADKMMAVDIAAQPNFSAGKPRMLFEGPYVPTPVFFPNYDVSPDGQRFLMIKPVEQAQAAPTQINVVLNWFEELKRRVPVGK